MNNTVSLEVVENPTLKSFPSIQHAFFTRQGGVSKGRYASLNCAFKSKDHHLNIQENMRRVSAHFGYPLESLIFVKNVHGNRAVILDQAYLEEEDQEADAIVTRQKGVILGSNSADCAIVLLADVQAEVIGIAHAGWRGAKSGILESTVRQMEKLGAIPSHIVAAISPCIAQDSYEVSLDFYQQFIADHSDSRCYFKPAHKLHHFMFDLPGFVEDQLQSLGLKSIHPSGINTYTDERFFSCRRAHHSGESDFGCQFSCIGLR